MGRPLHEPAKKRVQKRDTQEQVRGILLRNIPEEEQRHKEYVAAGKFREARKSAERLFNMRDRLRYLESELGIE